MFQVSGVLNFPPEAVHDLIGTNNPDRSITNQRAYLIAFFEQHLRHCHSRLLHQPTPRYPEMQIRP